MANPETGRSIGGQEAIDYLETIWNTHTKAEIVKGDKGHYLSGLAALVRLEEAHLHWLASQDIPQSPITIAPTGFPSLPTLLADAKAAMERHEAIIRSRQQTTLDILSDFAKMDAQALRENAPNRANLLTSSADGFMKTIERIEQHNISFAKDMVENSGDSKYKPRHGLHWVIFEKPHIVYIRTFDNKEKKYTMGYRFFPVDNPEHTTGSGQPFFLVFSLTRDNERVINAQVSPYKYSHEPDWMEQLNYNLINWDSLHSSIKDILFTYDTFRYRKHTETAFGALFKAYHGLQSLKAISEAKIGASKQEDALSAQVFLADGIAQIQTLPPELSDLIRAAIQDATRDIKEKFPEHTG